MEDKPIDTRKAGFRWGVSLSIIGGVGWLIFIIIWLAFYASAYPWEKNFAIFLLSLLIVGIVLGTPWSIWGMKQRTQKEKEMWKIKGFKWRVWFSGVFVIAIFSFLIYWFWFLAVPYSIYQNIAVIIVAFLVLGGVMGAMWAPWGLKYGDKFDEDK